MPPRGVKSAKRKRQYEHIKESAERRGSPRAEEIAARTVNKQRAQAGETKGRGRKRKSSKKSSGGRKSSSSNRRSSASSSRKGTRKTKRSSKRGRKSR